MKFREPNLTESYCFSSARLSPFVDLEQEFVMSHLHRDSQTQEKGFESYKINQDNRLLIAARKELNRKKFMINELPPSSFSPIRYLGQVLFN